MANTNGAAEVAGTPSKEQDANGQAEQTEEEGANGQQPDSTPIGGYREWGENADGRRHLQHQDQAPSRAVRDAHDGPHTNT